MIIQVDALYIDGVLRPSQPVALPDGTHVRLDIQTDAEQTDPQALVDDGCERPASAAGAWANFPEMDAIMAAVERSRTTDARPEVEL